MLKADHGHLLAKRVEIPVHYDAWARGARFGTVCGYRNGKDGSSDVLLVKLDARPNGRCLKVPRHDWPYMSQLANGYGKVTAVLLVSPDRRYIDRAAIGADIIEECTQPGQDASEPVNAAVKLLGLTIDRAMVSDFLNDYGAWDDLDTTDDATLCARLLWLACCHFKENPEEPDFYVGV